MSRLLPSLVAAVAITLAAPLAAKMPTGSGGGSPPGGGHGSPPGGGWGHGGGHGSPPGGGWGHGGGSHGASLPGGHASAGRYEFHGRAFSTLRPDERVHWATGAWRHELHNGIFGWWWFLDDDWFFYPDAIYPYPTYIAPLLTVQETPAPPPVQPYWYYCANPVGYYPYVAACPIGWQMVPAVPADAPAGAPPPPNPAP